MNPNSSLGFLDWIVQGAIIACWLALVSFAVWHSGKAAMAQTSARPWRYTMRHLLVAMTFVALALGMLVLVFK